MLLVPDIALADRPDVYMSVLICLVQVVNVRDEGCLFESLDRYPWPSKCLSQ